MSDIEYEFKPSGSGHTVWIKLKTPGINDTCSWAVTHDEFREFLSATFRAHCDAKAKRDDKRLQALGYTATPLAPINNYCIASGGGRPQQSSIRFEQPIDISPPRKRRAHEIIAEERDRIFRRYGIR